MSQHVTEPVMSLCEIAPESDSIQPQSRIEACRHGIANDDPGEIAVPLVEENVLAVLKVSLLPGQSARRRAGMCGSCRRIFPAPFRLPNQAQPRLSGSGGPKSFILLLFRSFDNVGLFIYRNANKHAR